MIKNIELYNLLKSKFNEVRIINKGQNFIYSVIDNQIRIEHWGECYLVCCPFCNDVDFDLSISHMYGQIEPITGKRLWPAQCFYGCNVQSLRQILFNPVLSRRYLHRDTTTFIEKSPVYIPESQSGVISFKDYGTCLNTIDLDDTHPAIQYLYERNITRDKMKLYDIKYCIDHINLIVKNRIVLPVTYRGELVGWVARTITDEEPKYYNSPGFKKNDYFYGYDQILDYDFIIIVEGPFDVLTIGPPAIATFSKVKDLSINQKMKLSAWRSKPILILFDGDLPGKEAANELYRNLTRKGDFDHVYILSLPEGKDPADLGPDGIWEFINAKVKSLGLNFSNV